MERIAASAPRTMDNGSVQLIGGPCGQHGPYTFYKAFKYTKNGQRHIMTLSEFFFVKLWMDSDLVCIGELQLLWADKNSEQVLASLRLYFLPENTPEGRMDHGEDEVLAISEKVVLKVEDLITWITLDAEWNWGRQAKYIDPPNSNQDSFVPLAPHPIRLTETALDFTDVEKERKLL
ncbi:PREDICTED: AT-rich interactive domain-containing protein 5B-like, partial [Nicrophorus vespilloides]|uniref:AT-rich interactive domain-containing protein 5B-like n=1 Tax=Nicrophorus vespilloides TaxID=110193 RepID=A0ABM1NJ62_NICVS